jgi:hypothetical protein
MSSEDEPRSGVRNPLLGPNVYGAAVVVMNVAFGVALLAAIWLICAVFLGHYAEFNQIPAKADRLRILANIDLASKGLLYGLGAGALMAAYVFFGESAAGYVILLAAAAVGLGVPFAFTSFGGESLNPTKSVALARSFAAFPGAAVVPAGIGALLVVRDVFLRLVSGVRGRVVDSAKLDFGKGAQKESRPVRTSILGKCWEGQYCREFIRVHCPIYQARAACWKQRRGCYCEEDIVSAAASRVQGVQLDMAPDQRYNFANPANPGGVGGGGSAPVPPRRIQLTEAQKRERCRNCIIYNSHQSEKYRLVMPAVLIATVVLCVVTFGTMRQYLGMGLVGIETLMNKLSFLPGSSVRVGRPSETVEWVLISAFIIMLVSKVLQTLEWAIFKLKI